MMPRTALDVFGPLSKISARPVDRLAQRWAIRKGRAACCFLSAPGCDLPHADSGCDTHSGQGRIDSAKKPGRYFVNGRVERDPHAQRNGDDERPPATSYQTHDYAERNDDQVNRASKVRQSFRQTLLGGFGLALSLQRMDRQRRATWVGGDRRLELASASPLRSPYEDHGPDPLASGP
jgi:hypothetical protein